MPFFSSKHILDGNLLRSKLQELSAYPDTQRETEKCIWDKFGCEYAVMFTDMAGFSSETSSRGILSALTRVYIAQEILAAAIEQNEGAVLKSMGDSLLAIFKNPDSAYNCATDLSRSELYSSLTIGIGYGKVLQFGKLDIYGEEVNLASRLAEDLGTGGQLLVTKSFLGATPNADPSQFKIFAVRNGDIWAYIYSG